MTVLEGCGFAAGSLSDHSSGLGLQMFNRTNPHEFLLIWLVVIIRCPESFLHSGLQIPLQDKCCCWFYINLNQTLRWGKWLEYAFKISLDW